MLTSEICFKVYFKGLYAWKGSIMSIFKLFSKLTRRCLVPALIIGLTACEGGTPTFKENQNTTPKDNAKVGNSKTARNVILFIGDGMGVSTVTAGRIFVGQEMGKSGEEHVLSFDGFDNVALVKTYNTNAQVADSAGTATAIMSGYKTNIGTVNVEPDKQLQGCGSIAGQPTLAKIASESGRSVGVIATARLTHATPAAMYGYAQSRDWEADEDMEEVSGFGCQSLAAQLVDPLTPVNLALGGGAKEFSKAQLKQWQAQDDKHVLVKNQNDFFNLSPQDTQDVLGLFEDSHMSFEADRDPKKEPSLAEMTGFAIENLAARNDNGYVLMVEAGRIDHAHHGGNAYRALKDFQAFETAIQLAIEKTGDDTLILVTADHSHVFTMAGYPKRGNPILGLVSPAEYVAEQMEDKQRYIPAKDGKPYTTLGYHNGPGPQRTPDSPALTDNEVQSPNYQQQTAVPMDYETHSGEDVPLYAHGPGAHRVKGVMEQDEIHDVMLRAMGVK